MSELPEGWLLDAEAETLAELAAYRVVLELGAWKGRSTVAMARTARLVVSVDWHRGDEGTGPSNTLHEYLANVRDLPNVLPVIGRFEDALRLFARTFDLVFVDGAHEYESVKRDVNTAYFLVKQGGVLVCHDWTTHPDVARAGRDVLDREPDETVKSLGIYRV